MDEMLRKVKVSGAHREAEEEEAAHGKGEGEASLTHERQGFPLHPPMLHVVLGGHNLDQVPQVDVEPAAAVTIGMALTCACTIQHFQLAAKPYLAIVYQSLGPGRSWHL